MKKNILFILLLTTITLFSQTENIQIKSITKIKKVNSSIDTTFYAFNNGKLISIKNKYKYETILEYNKKGLLSEKYYVIQGEKTSKLYQYNDQGYIIKIISKEGNKITGEMNYDYKLTNDSDFSITRTFTSYKIRKGVKFFNQAIYTMKNNTLTIKKHNVSGKFKHKSTGKLVFEKRNLKLSESGIKSKNNYVVSYSYDNKNGINSLLMKNIFGEKYFINSILIDFPFIIRSSSYISKNNLIAEKLLKKPKTIALEVFNNKIEYNSNNYPIKIIKTSDKTSVFEFLIQYD